MIYIQYNFVSGEIEREIVQRTQELVNERERRLADTAPNDPEEDDLDDDEDDEVDDDLDDEDDDDLDDDELDDETAANTTTVNPTINKRSAGSLDTSTKITLDPLSKYPKRITCQKKQIFHL